MFLVLMREQNAGGYKPNTYHLLCSGYNGVYRFVLVNNLSAYNLIFVIDKTVFIVNI